MLIRNVAYQELVAALARASLIYAGNIVFKRCDYAGNTAQGGEKWTVTLTVTNSAQPGARRSHTGRRISAACWHAYGHFMDALPAGCDIVVSNGLGRVVRHPGDKWDDWNAGSPVFPAKASTLCECQTRA